MGELLARPEALAEAWDAVYAHDAADEVVSAGVRRFAVDAQRRISEIAAELCMSKYVGQLGQALGTVVAEGPA
jgi:hypothetical protein